MICVRSCRANRSLLLQVGFGYMNRHFFIDDLAAEAGLGVFFFVSMLQPFSSNLLFSEYGKPLKVSKC
jgi:hypothetical protein